MAIYKDGEKWRVVFRYTDWRGERKQTQKRGFKTKREAQAWERQELLRTSGKLDMTFESFCDLYERDRKQRIKENTWSSKEPVIRTKIMPYFASRKIHDIEAKDIIQWQNELLSYKNEKGKPYSNTYIKTVHAQLSAIFNHAVKFYDLPKNPAKMAGTVGMEENKEMLFWTKEEYLRFADVMLDKPQSYYAFEMLYWCGMRMGELLALTPADFNFEKKTLTISKSYQRLKGKDIITTPKTLKSNRIIVVPDFLCESIKDFMDMNYELGENDRLFNISKSYLHKEMDRGAKISGVKRIRVHDIRHSAISLLIDMGFSPLAIAERVGHESINITYRYAHLFPTKQTDMANRLNSAKQEG